MCIEDVMKYTRIQHHIADVHGVFVVVGYPLFYELYRQCVVVGAGAIAIKRWVFAELEKKGEKFPFWRLEYKEGEPRSSGEDLYFAELCHKHGIKHHCDTAVMIPHMGRSLTRGDIILI